MMDEKTLRDAHAVFCEVFHSDMSFEAFRHKHVDNPERDPDYYILCDYDKDTPRGETAFLRYVVSCFGAKIYAVHPCDVAVSPKYRGQHIFSNIQLRGIERCRQRNIAFLFATPNQNSYPGYCKLGFYELGRLDRYDAVLRPVHLLLRKALRRAPALPPFRASAFPGGEWTLSLRCPFTEADIALMNSRPGVRLRRSLEFYRWKLDWLPEGEGAYLCARKGGRLEAFLALRRESDGSCRVCDWMLPEDPEASGRLLREARRLLRPHCELLKVSMVNPTGEEPARLKSGGFFRRNAWPQPFLIYPTAELEEETLSRLKDLRNWSLRYIDGDTVFN